MSELNICNYIIAVVFSQQDKSAENGADRFKQSAVLLHGLKLHGYIGA